MPTTPSRNKGRIYLKCLQCSPTTREVSISNAAKLCLTTKVNDFFLKCQQRRPTTRDEIISNAAKRCLTTKVYVLSQMLPMSYLSQSKCLSKMPPMPSSHKSVSLNFSTTPSGHQGLCFFFFLKCQQRHSAPRAGAFLNCCQCCPTTRVYVFTRMPPTPFNQKGVSLNCGQHRPTTRVYVFLECCQCHPTKRMFFSTAANAAPPQGYIFFSNNVNAVPPQR